MTECLVRSKNRGILDVITKDYKDDFTGIHFAHSSSPFEKKTSTPLKTNFNSCKFFFEAGIRQS